MKISLVIDLDQSRPLEEMLRVQEVIQIRQSKLIDIEDIDSEFSTVTKMILCANGAGLLMRCAENEGEMSSSEALKECIAVLENWFSDAEAIAISKDHEG